MSKHDDILAYRNIQDESAKFVFEYISKNDGKYFYENTIGDKKELEGNVVFAGFNENFGNYFYIIENENNYNAFNEQGKFEFLLSKKK